MYVLQFFNLILPTLLVAVTGLACIFLPSASDSKLNMAVTVVLTYIFLQALVADLTPKAPTSPLFGKYILSSLLLAAFYVVACGLIWQLSTRNSPPPRCLHFLAFFQSPAGLFCHCLKSLNFSHQRSYRGVQRQTGNEATFEAKSINRQTTVQSLSHQVSWQVIVEVLNSIISAIYLGGNVATYLIFLNPIVEHLLFKMEDFSFFKFENSTEI